MRFHTAHHRPVGRLAIGASLLAATVLALSACSGIVDEPGDDDGETVTLAVATMAPAGSPQTAVQDWFLDTVEERSEGRIVFERTAPEALCKAAEIVDCVRDGRAQIGISVPDYTPQYFPSTSMVSIPFLGQNAQAIMQTLYELHEPGTEGAAIMERNGLHHVATWPVGRLLFGTKQPLTGLDELSGLSMRASGSILQQVLSESGVNIQAITAPETYEAVERGVVEGVAGPLDFPVSYKLMEQLPYWSDPGIGHYSTFAIWISADTYAALPEDLRSIIDEAADELSGGVGVKAFNDAATSLCTALLEAPTVESLTAWDEAGSQAWADAVSESAQAKWIELASGQGLEDAQAVLDDYKAGLERLAGEEYDDATIDCVAQAGS